MIGGLSTAEGIWEWNGPNAVLVSANGVTRKPGATVVWVRTEGKLALTMVEGKVTGWTASGRGAYPIATGVASRQVVHLDDKVRWPGAIYHGR